MVSRRAYLVALLALGVFGLSSCMTSGSAFDRARVADLRNGAQTRVEIKEWFGSPEQIVKPLQGHPAGCVERWIYGYQHTYVGGKATAYTLMVDFDNRGAVCDHTYREIAR